MVEGHTSGRGELEGVVDCEKSTVTEQPERNERFATDKDVRV